MVKKLQGKTTLNKESKNLFKRNRKIKKWTDTEQNKLLKLVKENGEDWKLISKSIISKTAKQCMQKFKYIQRKRKKGNWSKQEDLILKKWVEQYGAQKWTECSELIQGRSEKQCKERWINTLNPKTKKGNWNKKEQEFLYSLLLEHHCSWSVISQLINDRTENAIKNYFNSSIRRLKKNQIFNLIEDLYLNNTIQLEEINFRNTFVAEESRKLNYLSRKISSMLFNPSKHKPQDMLFFLKKIFGDDFEFDFNSLQTNQINQSQQSEQNQQQQNQENIKYLDISFQYRGSSQQKKVLKLKKSDKECVLQVMKRYAEVTNNKNLQKFLNYLDVENLTILKDKNGHLKIILHQLKF